MFALLKGVLCHDKSTEIVLDYEKCNMIMKLVLKTVKYAM